MICPLCHAPVKWVRLFDDTWSPCDELPILFSPDAESRTKIVSRRELVPGRLFRPGQGAGKAILGRLPHYYSCPALREERRAWVIEKRKEGTHGKKYSGNGAGRYH